MGEARAAGRAVRRAPFADNPTVGPRGRRTRDRILDAALVAFGDVGYERTTIEQIAQLAGCSRVACYQYFSGKDDVFRHLAGQVARELRASVAALDPVTPDGEGREAIRAWVGRHGDIHERYEPVFRAFSAAADSDATLSAGSERVGDRQHEAFAARVGAASLTPRLLGAVVPPLLATVTRSLTLTSILRAALPRTYPRDRTEAAITDVVHRTLFGLVPEVNAGHPGEPPPALPIGPAMLEVFERAAELERQAAAPGRRALAAVLAVGSDVVVARGYHGTRVDDVVAAAGVSHGAFYRYFSNTDELVRIVAAQALRSIAGALAEVPDLGGRPDGVDRAALRRWLRRYNDTQAEHGAVIRVWFEAGLADDTLRADQPAVFDWGRRQTLRLVHGRGFGDTETDAVVLLALVEAFGARPRTAGEVDAVVRIVERGLLGRVPARR